MNFRSRHLVIAIRILLGLIMLASGISGLLMGNSTQGVPEQMVAFTQVFWASGIFQMVKVTEIAAGFMLVFGIFPRPVPGTEESLNKLGQVHPLVPDLTAHSLSRLRTNGSVLAVEASRPKIQRR